MTARIQSAQAFGKVAVLMGGRSAEREISLRSGQAILDALQQRGVQALSLDAGGDDFVSQLGSGGFDRAFIALHGRGGEDGVVQGLLESLGIPYTGSGVLGSALSMDKLRTKQVWAGAGLPTPTFTVLQRDADLQAVPALGFPVMLKPVREGSSIGMTKVEQERDLKKAWQEASRFDREVLAESWVYGVEYTAAIVADTALPLIRLETPREFYDYEAKYLADTTRYHCPCGLLEDVESGLQDLAMRAFRVVGASGWGRVDFFVDAAQRPWLIEVNTVPGMTDHSLVPMAAQVYGWDMPELVWRILESSMAE
ncbi:MAG: D-alanine--D-alanine ligase [Gammaproteobacteria bacterium]|nr:MAG: D-alanine--D-alanine ligase [Gammaproteobacteria bacterium]